MADGGIEEATIEPVMRTQSRILAEPVGRWCIVAVIAVAIASTRGLTLPPTLIVTATGIAMALVGRSLPPPPLAPAPPAARGGTVLWTTLLLLFCAVELGVFLLGNNHAYPTFSMLVDPVVTWPPTRALATVGWLAWGWYLLRR